MTLPAVAELPVLGVGNRRRTLKTRPDEELRLLSDHVLWHVRMLFGLSERIEATALRVGPSFSAPEDAALLESLAVHARALIEFFWKEDGAWLEDGRAAQVFDEGQWAKIRRPMPHMRPGPITVSCPADDNSGPVATPGLRHRDWIDA